MDGTEDWILNVGDPNMISIDHIGCKKIQASACVLFDNKENPIGMRNYIKVNACVYCRKQIPKQLVKTKCIIERLLGVDQGEKKDDSY